MEMRNLLAVLAIAGTISSATSVNAATCGNPDDETGLNSSYVAEKTCSTDDEDEN